MPTLPTALHASVKPFQLRGLRNYSIQVPIDPACIREVKGIWSQAFKQGVVHGPTDSELYVTMQKSPEQKVRYSAMGRLFEFIKKEHDKDKCAVKAFWAPDFCIYAEPPRGQAVLIASLNPVHSVSWTGECQTFLGCSVEEAVTKLSGFQQSA